MSDEIAMQKEIWRQRREALQAKKDDFAKQEKQDILKFGSVREKDELALQGHKETQARNQQALDQKKENHKLQGEEQSRRMHQQPMTAGQKEAVSQRIKEEVQPLQQSIQKNQEVSRATREAAQKELAKTKKQTPEY